MFGDRRRPVASRLALSLRPCRPRRRRRRPRPRPLRPRPRPRPVVTEESWSVVMTKVVMSIGNQEFGIPRKYQYQIGIWYLCPKFRGILLVFYR